MSIIVHGVKLYQKTPAPGSEGTITCDYIQSVRSTYSFLQWFVREQIEEETLFYTILQKFDLLGKDKLAVYQIDQSLSPVRSQVMSKQTSLKYPSTKQ